MHFKAEIISEIMFFTECNYLQYREIERENNKYYNSLICAKCRNDEFYHIFGIVFPLILRVFEIIQFRKKHNLRHNISFKTGIIS